MGQTAGASQQKAQLAQNQANQAQEQAQAEQQLGTYNTSVAGLTDSINQTQADVNQLPGSITKAQGAVDQAQTDVTGMSPSIQQAQTDVNAESADIGAQSNAAAQEQSDVNALQQTPGYTSSEIGAMDANAAGQIHGQFGDEMTQLKANAATQGGNDAGLSSQLASATQQRALATEGGAQNIAVTAANANLAGRQALPGQQAAAANTEAGVTQAQNTQAGAQGAVTGQLSNQTSQQGAVAGEQGAITGQLVNQAGAQGAVTGQEAQQAGLEYQPVSTLTNEATATGGQDATLIGQMPKQNPWLTTLQQGLSSAGAAAAGAAVKCYVAAELWGGWTDPRTILMRSWLDESYSKTPVGAVLVAIYVRFGERAAQAIRYSKALRGIASKVFEAGLRRAQKWREGLIEGQITNGRL